MYTGTYGLWDWLGWFIFGIGLGVAGTIYFYSLKAKRVTLRWYEWLLAIAEVFLVGFTVQNFLGSFTELEPQAAWLMLVFLGVPAVILGVVFVRLLSSHAKLEVKA